MSIFLLLSPVRILLIKLDYRKEIKVLLLPWADGWKVFTGPKEFF